VIGLDTNVLVRYFAQDDVKQTQLATHLIENQLSNNDPGFISLLVLAEASWALQKLYKVTRAALIQIIEKILTTRELNVESTDIVYAALRSFRNGQAEFSDCLIEQLILVNGCDKWVTFDVKAAKLSKAHLLK